MLNGFSTKGATPAQMKVWNKVMATPQVKDKMEQLKKLMETPQWKIFAAHMKRAYSTPQGKKVIADWAKLMKNGSLTKEFHQLAMKDLHYNESNPHAQKMWADFFELMKDPEVQDFWRDVGKTWEEYHKTMSKWEAAHLLMI